MRIDIYEFNEKKLLQKARNCFNMTPTQYINFIIDKITLEAAIMPEQKIKLDAPVLKVDELAITEKEQKKKYGSRRKPGINPVKNW